MLLIVAASALAYDVLVLVDGQQLEGDVVLLESGKYRLTLGNAVVMEVSSDVVTEVRYDVEEDTPLPPRRPGHKPSAPGEFDLRDDLDEDPGATRYLLGKSAWNLGNLSGYFGQEEVALTTVGVGLGPYFDVVASSVLPLSASPYSQNYCLDLKFGAPLGERHRMAVGAHFTGFAETGWTSLYGVLGIGKRSRHLSLGGGGIYAHQEQETTYFLTAAFQHRVGPALGLLGENFLVVRAPSTTGADVVFVPSFALRFYTKRVSFDLGLGAFDAAVFSGYTQVLPLPWFSVHYNWRGPQPQPRELPESKP